MQRQRLKIRSKLEDQLEEGHVNPASALRRNHGQKSLAGCGPKHGKRIKPNCNDLAQITYLTSINLSFLIGKIRN